MSSNRISYKKDNYLSIWLCNTKSEDILYRYVEIDYEEDDDDDDDFNEHDEQICFQLGRDFNIFWYDEDFFEASFRDNVRGWDLLEGHSYMENIIPMLKENYQNLMNDAFNSVIIFYNFKYDGNVREVENEQYGHFRFVGAFEYQC